MRDRNKELQISSEAEIVLSRYLKEVQKTLKAGKASQAEIKKITKELREHILQACWKETGSNFMKAEDLQELLGTMGDPQEVATEYLVDRRDTYKTTDRFSDRAVPSAPRSSSPKPYFPKTQTFFHLVMPLITAVAIYLFVLVEFSRMKDMWLVFFAISDIALLVPLVWYQFRWKKTENLSRWREISPRKMQIYFLLGAILLVLGGLLLPNLRGEDYDYYDPPYENTLTLTGYNGQYWIKGSFIFLASVVQIFLLILFLIAASHTSIHWNQADVRMALLEVKPPIHADDTGLIRIQTTNCNPITFPQIQMEILNQSPNLQSTIEPSTRTAFAQHDVVNWFIRFTPKIAGNLTFGRIVLHLGDLLTVSSPKYRLLVQKSPSFPAYRELPSKPDIIGDFPAVPVLTDNCAICRQSFEASDHVASCLLCGSLFHLQHLQEWLKGHESCPNCAKLIKVSELKRTYGSLVLDRLEKLESEFRILRNLLDKFEQASPVSTEILSKTPKGLESFEENR